MINIRMYPVPGPQAGCARGALYSLKGGMITGHHLTVRLHA